MSSELVWPDKTVWFMFRPNLYCVKTKMDKKTKKRVKLHYGLTAGILVERMGDGPDGSPELLLKVSFAFCSPKETKFVVAEGRNQAQRKMVEGSYLPVVVPLRDLIFGRLERRIIQKLWDYIFDSPNVESFDSFLLEKVWFKDMLGIEQRADDLGFPMTLAAWFVYDRKH